SQAARRKTKSLIRLRTTHLIRLQFYYAIPYNGTCQDFAQSAANLFSCRPVTGKRKNFPLCALCVSAVDSYLFFHVD
ncbi:MAG: hypothetical protein KAU38_00605, partial [Desulfobacterales bacterium]|nr:hypothetical protein [Desulfobacterales bacterium]